MTTHANPCIARFQRLLAYETWANTLLLDALDTVPDASRTLPAYDRAVRLIPHNVLARRIWLSRLANTTFGPVADWFPAWPLAQTRQACAETDADWSSYLAALAPQSLSAPIHYTGGDGIARANIAEDIITHAFNHSTYHRGQLARLIHECGGNRPSTDFIGFARLHTHPASR